MAHAFHSARALWLATAALTLAACGETGAAPRSSQPLRLSVTTRSGAAPSAAGLSADLHIGSGANSLTISQVQVVLARIELSSTGGCAPGGPPPVSSTANPSGSSTEPDEDKEKDEDDDDCDELEAGPVLVDLPVDGSTKVILDALVPPGTYSALEAKLDDVSLHEDDEHGASAFLTAHPEFADVSVKVTGVFTDANNHDHPFTFTSELNAHAQAEFQPPVTVSATTSNLTVNVDVASWFKDATGAAIDPTNSANAKAIERNIRQSLKAFEDNDHDGLDDHEEHHGDHEP